MAKTNRKNLKDRFKNGRMPSESDFADLIDSMINALDEGYEKTAEDGLKVTQLMGSGRLMSFYENLAVDRPQWYFQLGARKEGQTSLHISSPQVNEGQSVVSMHCTNADENNAESQTTVAVGINQKNPDCELDVNGVVAMSGRRGVRGSLPVPADGQWHNITEELAGCQAFEIMAGVGGQDSEGHYALTHAFAMNVFGGKGSIDYRQAYFSGRCERIELRWQNAETKFAYTLQMRVKCAYKTGVWIRYHITQLWFDTQMVESLQEPGK